MTDHLIKNIEIRDFKCFDAFNAEGFTRINLIGGKNNVGKTAFMEACYVNASSSDLRTLVSGLLAIKSMREVLNILQNSIPRKNVIIDAQKFIEQSNNIFVKTNINTIGFKIEDREGVIKYLFEIGNEYIHSNVKDFSYHTKHPKSCKFIDNFGLSNYEITNNYSSVQKKDEEDYIDNLLKEFDPNIEAFKVIDETPQCKTGGKYLPITELGDGARHLVSIVTSLYSAENGHLFIDEIENGIHYTMLDDLWNMILQLSKKLNVQVFATTHSRECIESFNRVQLKLNNKESFYFELARNINQSNIFMRALDGKQLEYELTHKGKYRGE